VSEDRKTCFVIMPFSETKDEHTAEYWTKHFENFLKPLIEENSKVIAHCSKPLRGNIVKQIINDLVESQIVVADITDQNANVYWELGVRQSFKHGTVTIAEEGTELPFDIGGKGTLFYNPKNHVKMEEFRKRFKEALQDCLEHPDKTDSQVLESIHRKWILIETNSKDEPKNDSDKLDNGKLKIFRIYKKTFYDAIYYSENRIVLKGKEYSSPSAACKAVTKKECDGWLFWRFNDKNGKEQKLDKLRN
jgi:hypothetical protein